MEEVNVFDFFAGPGTDPEGNPGSPRIIQDELKAYCASRESVKAERIKIRLHFNDKSKKKIEQLRKCLGESACHKGCCEMFYSVRPFQDALTDSLPVMKQHGSANLVIMDQFGVKEVTPEVLKTLAGCSKTDILFFVASSSVHRFSEEPAIRRYYETDTKELKASAYQWIHRNLCNYFQSKLSTGETYHLAPFSLKTKEGNIYGVVFGSGHLRGLEKFLKVCWDQDGVTGEANYVIDDDDIILHEQSRTGQMPLPFSEEGNIARKLQVFHRELEGFLRSGKRVPKGFRPVNNRDVYRFTLKQGFLPKHAAERLRTLQQKSWLEVVDTVSGKAARKGAFYLSWPQYNSGQPRVVFQLKD